MGEQLLIAEASSPQRPCLVTLAMPRFLIESADDPRLAPYRELNQRNLARQSGRFIAEGDKVVLRLIDSRFEVDSLLAESSWADRCEPLLPPETPIYVASRQLLEATIGFNFHRGVLACGRRGVPRRLNGLLATLPERATLVVCPDVHDPANLASIIRSTAAFGAAGIVLGGECADPFSRRVLRVSMGAALHLPIIESTNLAADLQTLKLHRFELAATLLDPTAEPLATAQRSDRLALLFGNEGHGLPPEITALCNRKLTLPMAEGIDSLNVAIAAAIFLHHFNAAKALGGRDSEALG